MDLNMISDKLPKLKVLVGASLVMLATAGCVTDPGVPYAKERDAMYGKQSVFGSRGTSEATASRLNQADRRAYEDYQQISRQQAEGAYEAGVRDTMEEFRGRMDARRGFVWEPPLVEYVKVPGQVVNGAYTPEHIEPVIVSPGRWVEENGVQLPDDRQAYLQRR